MFGVQADKTGRFGVQAAKAERGSENRRLGREVRSTGG
jgi:hypothetical protein